MYRYPLKRPEEVLREREKGDEKEKKKCCDNHHGGTP
jgi:hypothetical protein